MRVRKCLSNCLKNSEIFITSIKLNESDEQQNNNERKNVDTFRYLPKEFVDILIYCNLIKNCIFLTLSVQLKFQIAMHNKSLNSFVDLQFALCVCFSFTFFSFFLAIL